MSVQNKFLDLNKYKIMQSIGKGSFGEVYRIKHKKSPKYYAAKVAFFMVDEDIKDVNETILLFREVNLISLLNHPSILKFIGYSQTNFEGDPKPTIVTEYMPNGSLRNIIEMEKSGIPPKDWNETKKLIIVYGLASGLSYMHKHKIVHRDLKPENILIDEFLYPKISDFGLSKIYDILSNSMNVQSCRELKGTPLYIAPEVYGNYEYSEASDVYAFAIIVYELFTLKTPFKGLNILAIIAKHLKEERPPIDNDVPDVYRDLIERCWSQDPKKRPSFQEIVDEMKSGDDYINELIDSDEFYDYVDFIDSNESSFDKSNQLLHFEEFIKVHGRNKNIKKVKLNEQDEDEDEDYVADNESEFEEDDIESINEFQSNDVNDDDVTNEINEVDFNKLDDEIDFSSSKKIDEKSYVLQAPMKIKEIEDENQSQIESNYHLFYPFSEFNKLNKKCQEIVKEAENDSMKQYEIAKSLLEGENQFPLNIELGKRYLNKSLKGKCIESMIYCVQLLIKGNIIQQDLNKAKKILHNNHLLIDSRLFLLRGKISIKEKKYSEAKKYFEEGIKVGNFECIYKCAKILFLGQGIKKNDKKAFEYFKTLSSEGHQKSINFLNVYQSMIQINEFQALNPETQYFFISNSIKNKDQNNFTKIIIQPKRTEILYYNNSMKSPDFYVFLSFYKSILIEIQYPSQNFNSLFDIISRIRDKHIIHMNIGIVITSFPSDISEIFKKENIFQFRIDSSVDCLTKNCFKNCHSLRNISIPSSVIKIGNSAFVGCSSLSEIKIPSSVTMIEEGVFEGCSFLKEIKIPYFVTSIGKFTFSNCSSLNEIKIPSSVTTIGEYAFNECSSLTHISIPSSVTVIGEYAFCGCKNLNQISIPSSVTLIKDWCFRGCSSLKQISIPSSVTSIGNHAFENCSSLVHISLPSSVIEINSFAFRDCSSLIQFVIPSSVNVIMNSAFCGCSSLKKIVIPSSIKIIKNSVFIGCSSLVQISIPSSVTSIESNAFRRCSSLTKIAIPSSVSSIGENAFSECSSLTQISIPSCFKLKDIGIDSNIKVKKI